MGLIALTAPLLTGIGSQWAALILAAVMMLAAVPVHIAAGRHGREKPWLWGLCVLMNTVSSSLSVAAFYLHAEFTVQAWPLLQGMLPAACVTALAALLLMLCPKYKKPALILAGLLAAVLVVLSLLPAVWPAQPQRSAMLFGTLTAVFYLVAYGLTMGRGDRPLLRDLSFGSFGAGLLVELVVLVILSDGDALEFFDLDLQELFSGRKRKMGNQPLLTYTQTLLRPLTSGAFPCIIVRKGPVPVYDPFNQIERSCP